MGRADAAVVPLAATAPAAESARVVVAAVQPLAETPDQGQAAPEPAGTSDEAGPPIFDESSEAVFLGEARERGETVRPAAAKPGGPEPEEVDAKPLPALATLVEQIPAEVRETLDDLFRVKFVRVQRVPRGALKG